MTKRAFQLVSGVVMMALIVAAGAAIASDGAGDAKPLRFSDSRLVVEVNATDGDAGLQVFLDGEPWREMRIAAPNGRTILAVNGVGRLSDYGLTELFSESSEPSFDVFPIEKFKALWPEGRYSFSGETIEGRKMTGAARLSHDFPAGPKIVAPVDGANVGRKAAVARWATVAEAAGVDIAGYKAIVTREDPLRILDLDLPPSARKLTIPAEFLEPGTEYKLEVQAIEKSGNRTLTEVGFRVR